jgi:hypothetical protein
MKIVCEHTSMLHFRNKMKLMKFLRDCDSGAGPSNCKSMIHKCKMGFHHMTDTDIAIAAAKQNGEEDSGGR